MKTPVKALSWQQAAKDYAEACGAEIHIVNEGHMMYTTIPEKLSKVFKAFLYKNNICDKQKPNAEGHNK